MLLLPGLQPVSDQRSPGGTRGHDRTVDSSPCHRSAWTVTTQQVAVGMEGDMPSPISANSDAPVA